MKNVSFEHINPKHTKDTTTVKPWHDKMNYWAVSLKVQIRYHGLNIYTYLRPTAQASWGASQSLKVLIRFFLIMGKIVHVKFL